ncbi:MAG TPA: hypothetical protein VJ140_01175 [Actinomycetota bacterium]|nr:hypothetical protein [Actinomycetota bacterium]
MLEAGHQSTADLVGRADGEHLGGRAGGSEQARKRAVLAIAGQKADGAVPVGWTGRRPGRFGWGEVVVEIWGSRE